MRRVRLRRSVCLLTGGAAALTLTTVGDASTPRDFRSLVSENGSAQGAGPLGLTRVTLGQLGDDLYLGVRTRGPLAPRQLAPDPRRRICVLIARSARQPPSRRVCITAVRRSRSFDLRGVTLTATGRAQHGTTLDAQVVRTSARSLTASFPLAEISLGPGPYSWTAESSWTGPACGRLPSPCSDRVPASGSVSARIAKVHAVGCTRPAARFVTNGSKGIRAVALTFDDGPSSYTASILATLERDRVNATFFTIGREIAGRESLLRRELRDGDVVGDHTWSHPNVSAGGSFARSQLGEARHAIEAATHFTPCLFRAPYGAVSPALFDVASSLGMTTIQWNVDPRDWSLPGTSAIVERVTSAVRAGSIVIMHDGGGPRQETAAALPRIISILARRGYRFETVPALLGQRVIYAR